MIVSYVELSKGGSSLIEPVDAIHDHLRQL